MLLDATSIKSPLESLDPRVKLVATVAFSVITAVANRFPVLLMALALGAGLMVVARVTASDVIRRLTPVNLLMLFLWLFLPLTYPGESIQSIGPFTVTREGVLYAARLTVKSNAIMMALIVLVTSTPVFTLGHAMHELGIPQKFVHLFLFTYRYIHVLYREYLRMANSLKIRNFRPGTNWHTYRTFSYMVGMLLVRSVDRADRVHRAMVCRGFNGRLYSLREFKFTGRDAAVLTAAALVVLALGVWEWVIGT